MHAEPQEMSPSFAIDVVLIERKHAWVQRVLIGIIPVMCV